MGQAAASPRAQIVRPSICLLKIHSDELREGCEWTTWYLRELKKHVNLALMTTSLDETVHHVHHPGGTLSARCALTARFVLVELQWSYISECMKVNRRPDLRERNGRWP